MQVVVHPTFSEPYWKKAKQLLLLRIRPDALPGAIAPLIGKDLLEHCDARVAPRDPLTILASWKYLNALPESWLQLSPFRAFQDLQVFSSPLALCLLVWLVLIAGLQLGHAALTVFLLLGCLVGAFCHIARVDHILLRTLLYQFDFWYLVLQAAVYLMFALWSQSKHLNAAYLIAFFVPALLHSLATLVSDAAVLQSYLVKSLLYGSAIVLFLELFIRDLAGDSMHLTAHRICMYFCTDTEHMMFVGALNLGLFYAKYLSQIVSGLRKRRTQFVAVRIPLSVSAEHRSVSQALMTLAIENTPVNRRVSAPNQTLPSVGKPGSTDDGGTAEDVTQAHSLDNHLDGHHRQALQSYTLSNLLTATSSSSKVDSGVTQSDSVPSGTTQQVNTNAKSVGGDGQPLNDVRTWSMDVRTDVEQTVGEHAELDSVHNGYGLHIRLTAKMGDTFRLDRLRHMAKQSQFRVHEDVVMCVKPFQPVLRLAWAHQVARSRLYQGSLVVWLALVVLLNSTAYFYNQGVLTAILCALGYFALFVELTRFDVTMVYAIASRFEWLILAFSSVQLLIFAPWSQYPEQPLELNIPVFIGYAWFISVVLGFSDAAPSYPYAVRVVGAGLVCLSTVRAIVQDYFSPYYNKHPVCFIFCTDTGLLALSASVTCSIFLGKYVISLVRFPNRCISAAMTLHFSLVPDDEGAASPVEPITEVGVELTPASNVTVETDGAPLNVNNHVAAESTLPEPSPAAVRKSPRPPVYGHQIGLDVMNAAVRRTSVNQGRTRQESLPHYISSFPMPQLHH